MKILEINNKRITSVIVVMLVGLAAGLFLEKFFRDNILSNLILNERIVKSALISSLLFALMHYGRIFRPNENIDEVNSIVIFAFCMGFFLVGIFLRTKNIIIPAIIHGLINFSFGTTSLKENAQIEITSNTSTDWVSVVLNFGILFFILLSGVYMINKSSEDEVLESLVK